MKDDFKNPYAHQPMPAKPAVPAAKPAVAAPAKAPPAGQPVPMPVQAAPEGPAQQYKVQVTCDQQVAGKCDMSVTETGVVFQWPKPLLGKALRIEKPWGLIREVKNRLAEKKPMFDLNTGEGKGDRVMKVRILEGDVAWLSQFLQSLPEDCFLPKCPRCGGAVVNEVCKQCAQSVTGAYRKQGIIAMVVGIVLALVGIIATAASYEAASAGGSYTVWWGAVLVGVISFFKGLYQVLSGRK